MFLLRLFVLRGDQTEFRPQPGQPDALAQFYYRFGEISPAYVNGLRILHNGIRAPAMTT
jgi:hypothetical protein